MMLEQSYWILSTEGTDMLANTPTVGPRFPADTRKRSGLKICASSPQMSFSLTNR